MTRVETRTTRQHVAALRTRLGGASARELLAWALAEVGQELVLASSFGAEDMVLTDMLHDLAAETGHKARVVTLDTGRLPQQTLEFMDLVRTRYQLRLDVRVPQHEALEALVEAGGLLGFRRSIEDRLACCRLRKVDPLARALAGVRLWVTGQRRSQSPTRAGLQAIEVDPQGADRVKLNPLAEWGERDVWDYLRARRVPTHPLHDEGYASLGCEPCTRAVNGWQPGASESAVDIRAGRWWWEQPEHKECGLHLPAGDGRPEVATPKTPSPRPPTQDTP